MWALLWILLLTLAMTLSIICRCVCFCGLACLHCVCVFVTSRVAEHGNANKWGRSAPLAAGGRSNVADLSCAANEYGSGTLARARRGPDAGCVCSEEDRALLYWVCSVSCTCAGWRSTPTATRRRPARRRSWARTTSGWCRGTWRRRTRWMWWVVRLSPLRSTTSTTTSRLCRWAAGAPRAPSSTWRTRTPGMLHPTMASTIPSQGRALSSLTSSSTACRCLRWDLLQSAPSFSLPRLPAAREGSREGRGRSVAGLLIQPSQTS